MGLSDAFAASCRAADNAVINPQILLIHVLAHELGHQRAGLTHIDQFPQFHAGQGTPPTRPPRYDVMYANANSSELRYKLPVFDRLSGGPFANSQATCQDNLYHWRSITN